VRLASAVPAPAIMAGHQRALWQGQAQWQSPAFTTRLEDLLTVSQVNVCAGRALGTLATRTAAAGEVS
jgi:hypothetical protein